MTSSDSPSHTGGQHAIIAGFGIPGRMIAEQLHRQSISYCVIEMNAGTVERCVQRGVPIIVGDARDEQVLRQAGIDRATLVAVTLPDEAAALETVQLVRRLNSGVRIIARCAYTSCGLEAVRQGADEVIVAEQVVASEFTRLLGQWLHFDHAPGPR